MMNLKRFCERKANLSNHKRGGISPILATVILIAITLVAAVAMAAFVFGLFGSLGSSANLSTGVAVCSSSDTGLTMGSTVFAASAGGKPTCFMNVINSGTASGTLSGCSIGGIAGILFTSAGAVMPASGITVAGSKAVGVECNYAGGAVSIGAHVGGILTTVNLGVSFAGTWLT